MVAILAVVVIIAMAPVVMEIVPVLVAGLLLDTVIAHHIIDVAVAVLLIINIDGVVLVSAIVIDFVIHIALVQFLFLHFYLGFFTSFFNLFDFYFVFMLVVSQTISRADCVRLQNMFA